MSEQKFMAIHPIVVETCHSKGKKNVNLILAQEEKLGDHQSEQGSSSVDHECLNQISRQCC